jgi:alkaline phosphatase
MRAALILLGLVFLGCPGSSNPPDGGPADPDAGQLDAGERDGGTPDAGGPGRPAVILMIGDGMGKGQLEAASHYGHGRAGALFLESLPHSAQVLTGSLSGITDSAASATSLATGVRTFNGRVGLDRYGNPVQTLVELAHARGQRAGIVSTASLPHATPGAFSAHRMTRHDYLGIAEDQALRVRPDVMLGGGRRYYLPAGSGSDRSDDGLISPLQAAGYQVAFTREELQASSASSSSKVLGLFAANHLDYVQDRPAGTTEPTLTELSLAALRHLEPSEKGFFLMIEGARMDMASHLNDLPRTIGETLDFDQAVRAVTEWAKDRPNTTVLVTADHECGGLTVVQGRGAGVLPEVQWRWGEHTNDLVGLWGMGEGTDRFDGQLVDQRWIHALVRARLTGEALSVPERLLVADGHLADLRHRAASQQVESGFGPGLNQLDRLWIDADAHGLSLGLEGLWEWNKNALVLLLDVDFGAGTGPARLAGALGDLTGKADALVTNLSLDAPAVSGFGVDFALVSWGGTDARLEDLIPNAGLRGLRAPYGQAGNFGWHPVATNFAQGVRTVSGTPSPLRPEEGYEAFIHWSVLYPGLDGKVPPNATIAVAAVLVNDDGGYTSNQALPPFPAGTANPGRIVTPLPGLLIFQVDSNGDGVADGDAAPTLLP